MSTLIHETAIVSQDAALHESVSIGPGAIIEGNVEIGKGTRIGPYAVIREFTRMGSGNSVDAHCVIGGLPQHAAFDGSKTELNIGDNNIFREYVTINRAFYAGAETRIGSNCFVMANAHIGHDSIVGDNVTITNNVSLAGHVELGSNAVMGGYAGAQQFTRVGPFCMIASYTKLNKDALPFTMIAGIPPRHLRLNKVGLNRNGIDGDRYRALEAAFRALRRGDRDLENIPDTEDVRYLREWMAAESKMGMLGFSGKKKTGA